jgi:hypothetical protein
MVGLLLGVMLVVCIAAGVRERFYTTPSPQLSEAIVLLTMDEVNNLRGWIVSFKAATAAASSLADLKTRVAALPNMPDRTTNQLVTELSAKLDAIPDYESRTRNATFRVEP